MSALKKVPDDLFNMFSKTATRISMYFDEEEAEEHLKDLKETVKQTCVWDRKLRKAHEITERLSAPGANEEDGKEIAEQYKDEIAGIDTDVSRHPKLLEFGEQTKALMDDAKKNGGDKEVVGGDEELMMTEDAVNVIDPISKVRIKDPVKNTECGHVYDRESVTAMLRANRKTKCPFVGCKSKGYVLLDKLQTDVQMKTYLLRHPA